MECGTPCFEFYANLFSELVYNMVSMSAIEILPQSNASDSTWHLYKVILSSVCCKSYTNHKGYENNEKHYCLSYQ